MDILIAVSVVAGIGLVAGILLAIASHFFAVKEDETVKRIRDCLPGANCGACGYTGCDGYAEALAAGKAAPHLCVPGAGTVARELGSILGVEVKDIEPMVAFVHCNGTCDATHAKAQYAGMPSCGAAGMFYGGPGACRFGCIGCGDCAAVCPQDAICLKDGIARVDSRLCIACGKCVDTCPKGLITLMPRDGVVAVQCHNQDKGAVARKDCTNACIGCKKCQLNCPAQAITVTNNLANVDYSKCIGCGKCVETCPTHCLKTVDFSLIEES